MRKEILIAAAVLISAFAIAPANAAGKAARCQQVGGGATMLTEDLARYMAQAALKNVIAAKGLVGKGKISVTCDKTPGLPNCHARQKACA